MIGPFRGGRTLTAAGISGQPNTYYFGAVGGGVWKSTNGGLTWEPIFDLQPISSIGALAIAPSDTNVIYVGSGEADMRSDISFGTGIYKSTDAGATWTHLGLADTKQVGRIIIDPRDPNAVLVAALGHAYGANPERGVYRSSNGGRTWQRVLYKDKNTGAIDLAIDPSNPQVVYATLWNARRTPWSQYPPVSGPGGGLYRSRDGGLTWTELRGHGLPEGNWGRTGIAVTAAGKRIYALIDEANEGGLYRSDDGGQSWRKLSDDQRIRTRSWYFGMVTVDTSNPDIVYVPDVALYRSTDGGRTFEAFKGAPGGDDYHSLWIDPSNSSRMILASDQGAAISVDGGKSWSSWNNQPTAQLYHVSTDNQFPYYVYGAQQDSGTVAITSRGDNGSITFRDWYSVGAGEAGYIAPDPSDPDVVYGGDSNGSLFRFDKRHGQSQDISPVIGERWGLAMPDRKLRFTWTSPLVFSPHDPHTLYFGAQYVLRSTDRGGNWQAISPDLTGAGQQPPESQPVTVTTAKRLGYGVVYTIAPSPMEVGVIWVGTDTGLIHLTRDGGKTWTDVTPRDLGDWSEISLIEASRFGAGTAYAAVDRHCLNDYQPYIYRTHDYGKTWQKVVNGIAAPAYVHVVREDSVRQGLLYAGTETGIYVSFDDGGQWQSLQLNLPVTPVHDLVVHDDDLVVATHGRSFWILDDVMPLREASADTAAQTAHLFRPQVATRVRASVNRDTPLSKEEPAGQNPPAGAIMDYYLAADAVREVILEIRDKDGNLVRRFSSSDRPAQPTEPPPLTSDWLRPSQPLAKTAGMHRFVWDLQYAPPSVLKTEYSMSVAYGETTPAWPPGPLVLPGDYQVRLSVDGLTFTQPLTVRMDPRVQTSPADLDRQFRLAAQIADTLTRNTRAYREIAEFRAGLNKTGAPADEVDRQAAALMGEEDRPDNTVIERGREPSFYALDASLRAELQAVESADTAPTDSELEAFAETERELDAALRAWRKLRLTFVPFVR